MSVTSSKRNAQSPTAYRVQKKNQGPEKQKACLKAGFLNLAPLTGIAFAINWLKIKLN
ncbi:hypothetical protein POH93_16915 [Phytobacter diazotrophicus]|uniref:hypothetical protein n=1 Tax=Phytobacter diazotrophicus TaxID=395631 RepID=UPI002330D343|nr:hypothetical protein [Phytobacter diazotrophicus]MDC0727064.1 hypothetical protein [Phytobacter diazotrophicus]MDC0734414.1 hypothetical protein [Phytobacter diazotrophicus]